MQETKQKKKTERATFLRLIEDILSSMKTTGPITWTENMIVQLDYTNFALENS